MPGVCNYSGVTEQAGFSLLPDGEYTFEIIQVEATQTKNSDPMVKIILECKDKAHLNALVFDNIILPVDENSSAGKIAGRTKHFLHCIGEPYEGQFEWNENNWYFKWVCADISTDEYNGKKKNVVKSYNINEKIKNDMPNL